MKISQTLFTVLLVAPAALAFAPSFSSPRGAAFLSTRSNSNSPVSSPPSRSIVPQQQQQRQQQQHVLYMGWGPDPIWSLGTVTSKADACPSGKSVLLQVAVKPETAAEYQIPGQYVQMRLNSDTKPLFLAISSAPDAENASFEFLVKKTDGNEWLTGIRAGTAVDVSQVLGSGYPMEENLESLKFDFPTQNVLLLAAGSGIAPIKAAVESGQLKTGPDSTRTCRLYYGERTQDDLCFTNEFAAWEAAGVQVVPVLSQPDDNWAGRAGYVQSAIEEDGVDVPRNTGALVCGMKGMADASKELLTAAGVFEGRVLFNF